MCNQKSTSEKDRQYIEHMEKDITKIDKVLIKAKQKKNKVKESKKKQKKAKKKKKSKKKSHCQYNIIVSLCKVMQQ